MAIKVLKSGLFTTIQDLGRNGYQASGIPVGGSMDRFASKLANIILGNDENEAVLEMTFTGPTLQFEENAVIAISGANMSPKLNGKTVDNRRPLQIEKGDRLTFSSAYNGVRTYLAVKGGFSIPTILGSKSTNSRARFGGVNGKTLSNGDYLSLNQSSFYKDLRWGLKSELENYLYDRQSPIRFIKGRQYDWFKNEMRNNFSDFTYTISPDSDRMGYRLLGPAILKKKNMELTTEGTAFGTIQIPPSGEPIILMADRQPTGGYPKIGEVIGVDFPRLSQLRPGEEVHFEEISLSDAQTLFLNQFKEIEALKIVCELKWRDTSHV